MPQKLARTNQSVEKTLQIIEIMANNREPMRLQDIALKVSLPASTVLRMVYTLMNAGYVNQDSISQRYSLSLKFAQIGYLVSSQTDIRTLARPLLIALSQHCHEASCLAVDENMEVVYIDVVEGPDSLLRIMQRIGKRAPMHCTGVGKLMLQEYSATQLDKYIAVKGLPATTPNTLVTKESLVKELEKIGQQGFAIDDEECELGARCLAAPVRDYSGKIIAGISVSGPISRMTPQKITHYIPIIMQTAQDISALLAYSGPSEKQIITTSPL